MFDDIFDGIEFPSEDPIVEAVSNPSLTDEPRDSIPRIKVPVRVNDSTFITSVENRLAFHKHRRSMINNHRVDPLAVYKRTDGLDYHDLWIKNDLQVKIEASGCKKDAVIATLWHRFLPSTNWLKLGVLNLIGSEKKIRFSSIEMNYIDPDIRLRILGLLACYGLIPNEIIKDANCSGKTTAILFSEQLQEKLKVSFHRGSNPTIPYRLSDDRRAKHVEVKADPHTVEVSRYSPYGKFETVIEDLQSQLLKSKSQERKSKEALIRANRDADQLRQDRGDLIASRKVSKPVLKPKIDLSR